MIAEPLNAIGQFRTVWPIASEDGRDHGEEFDVAAGSQAAGFARLKTDVRDEPCYTVLRTVIVAVDSAGDRLKGAETLRFIIAAVGLLSVVLIVRQIRPR